MNYVSSFLLGFYQRAGGTNSQIVNDFGELVSPNVQSYYLVLVEGEVMWTECWLLLWPSIVESFGWEE